MENCDTVEPSCATTSYENQLSKTPNNLHLIQGLSDLYVRSLYYPTKAEMPTSADSLFSTPPLKFQQTPPPPPRQIDPAPNGNDLGHYTIKIRYHRFDARDDLCQ